MQKILLITAVIIVVALSIVTGFMILREQANVVELPYADTIEGAGASFQYPQIVEWASVFRAKKGINVNYQSVGTGAGQKMFLIDKVVHFAASDPPLSRTQFSNYTGQVLQVPWIMGAVVVVYNIPGLDVPLNLSGEVIAGIYLGEIMYWDDPAILQLNPALLDKLPRKEIIAVHRSDSSGTTEVFTTFLYKSAGNKWPKELVGKQIDWPVDKTGRGIGAKGNEGVTAQVKQSPYSIGYIEFSYAIEQGLQYAAILNKAGRFVLPSEITIRNAALAVTIPSSPLDDFSHTLAEVIYPLREDAYPISTLAYGLFWAKYEDPAVARSIAMFLRWIASEGYNHMVRGYVKPPQQAVELLNKAAEIIEKNSTG